MFESGLDPEHAFVHHGSMERTYVRRRATVAALGVALGAVLLSPLAAGAARQGDVSQPPTERRVVVVVQPGDTLWSIARRLRPADDPRTTVEAIVQLNAVDAGSITPGQPLAVPLG
jgi:Tfp pilus assembly protein FimV